MASPGNRKRRSTDSATTSARRMTNSQNVREAHASGLLHQVSASSMNSNNSPSSMDLWQLPSSKQSEGSSLSGVSSSDLQTEEGALTDDDFPTALATSWLTMTRCLAPLHRILLPEARHILTSAVRLMNEDIVSLLIQKVQQALALASNRESQEISQSSSHAPVFEDEGMPFPGYDDMEETSEINTACTTEPMDWEGQQAESTASMNVNLNVNLYMASANAYNMPVQV